MCAVGMPLRWRIYYQACRQHYKSIVVWSQNSSVMVTHCLRRSLSLAGRDYEFHAVVWLYISMPNGLSPACGPGSGPGSRPTRVSRLQKHVFFFNLSNHFKVFLCVPLLSVVHSNLGV